MVLETFIVPPGGVIVCRRGPNSRFLACRGLSVDCLYRHSDLFRVRSSVLDLLVQPPGRDFSWFTLSAIVCHIHM